MKSFLTEFRHSGLMLMACMLVSFLCWGQNNSQPATTQPLPAQQPSLADVARQQRAAKKAKRVITDEDLPKSSTISSDSGSASSGSGSVSPASGVPATAAASADSLGEETKDKTAASLNTEAAGKDQRDPRKERIEAIKADEASLTKKLSTLEEKAGNEPDEFRRNMYLEALEHQKGTLENMKKEREDLQKSVAEKAQAEPPAQKQDQAPK